MNRSATRQDTAAPEAWRVTGPPGGVPGDILAPGGTLDLACQTGSGCVDTIQLQLQAARDSRPAKVIPALDPAQVVLAWESSPLPPANEAGRQPRLIDGCVPLAALCGFTPDHPPRVGSVAAREHGLTSLQQNAAGALAFSLRLPMPYTDGLRLRLLYPSDPSAGAPLPLECRWQVAGRVTPPPPDRRYLRAQWLARPAARPAREPVTPHPGEDHTLFETHGRGALVALLATGAADPHHPAGCPWTLTWFLEGDERLPQIEEHAAGDFFGGRPQSNLPLPAFAEYIKLALRWTAAPPASPWAVVALALVEDRPIA